MRVSSAQVPSSLGAVENGFEFLGLIRPFILHTLRDKRDGSISINDIANVYNTMHDPGP